MQFGVIPVCDRRFSNDPRVSDFINGVNSMPVAFTPTAPSTAG